MSDLRFCCFTFSPLAGPRIMGTFGGRTFVPGGGELPRLPLHRLSRAGSMDSGVALMRERRATGEHPFGTMKARMGATHFLTNLAEGRDRDGSARAGGDGHRGDLVSRRLDI